MNNIESALKLELREQLDGLQMPNRLPAIRRRARRGRYLVVTFATVLLSVTAFAALWVADATNLLDRDPEVASHDSTRSPSPSNGATIQLIRFQCGSGSYGDEDSQLPEPRRGVHCTVGIGILNGSSEAITLDLAEQHLVVDEKPVPLWRKGMRKIFLDDPGNVFEEPIPPGGGALDSMLFRLRGGPPSELTITAGDSTVAVPLDCHYWSDSGGSCTAPPRFARKRRARVGVPYPHKLLLYPGGVQPTCFDRREWEPIVLPSPQARDRWIGQGVIQLVSTSSAQYRDNSGEALELEPSDRSQDERVC